MLAEYFEDEKENTEGRKLFAYTCRLVGRDLEDGAPEFRLHTLTLRPLALGRRHRKHLPRGRDENEKERRKTNAKEST